MEVRPIDVTPASIVKAGKEADPMRSKRHVAVLKQDELLLPDHDTATALMGAFLVEGWEDYHTVYYGVLPGFDLDDVDEAIDRLPSSTMSIE